MSRATDDEDEEVPVSHRRGTLDPIEDPEHDAHPAGWLYFPDLTMETGWGGHRVPVEKPKKTRQVGFHGR